MRNVIGARLKDNAGRNVLFRLPGFEHSDGERKQVELSLIEGKFLLKEPHRVLVNMQADGFVTVLQNCFQYGALSIRAEHTI
ncbi:hypothetical protein ABC383_23080 [Noviherbaspirillum sp. 1P10PC]|uniref:hypothetical protein n=1 Tax=Noviherbaspirillum sp. 1P10PC TaxID=3132292 RepID=UPI00399EEBD2